MTYSRNTTFRMGAQRRMFSRRSVVGLLTGILLGFNLASWLVIPVPSHTDIEIEVIARNGGDETKRQGIEFAEFRLGATRIRRKQGLGLVKIGHDCDHEFVDYGNAEHRESWVGQDGRKSRVKNTKGNRIEDISDKDKANYERALELFDLQQERLKRQKELEVFYESDIENEDDGDEMPQDRLEDFQLPANVQKYVEYDPDTALPVADGEPKKPEKYGLTMQPSFLLPKEKTPRSVHLADRKHFIYVGVLTAQKYLSTRGRAIIDTWAYRVPGKVEFYVGEDVKNPDDGGKPLPLVQLKTVKDDVYPPQKKSFLLLKNMYDNYLNSGYQWFMRADDDVYIKIEELEKFLRRLNSSQPIFLGQTGLGNAEERGRLSLAHGDNYCMGGPGMIFSREVVRRVGPHIQECVKKLYSWHEDVELSRCIRNFADVNCAWSYQMQELFYEHYTLRKGYIDPFIEPNNPKLYTALTLHPNKNPAYQVKLHKFMNFQKIQNNLKRIKTLSREIVSSNKFLNTRSGMEEYMLGIAPTLRRFVPRKRDEVLPWDFMSERLWYSFPPHQARRAVSTDRQLTARSIIMRVMQTMNANSKARGRVIDFKQIGYGYRRINPLFGVEYVLDLMLVYKRFKGKKLTIPVRRHAYLQQSFSRAEIFEQSPLDDQMLVKVMRKSKAGIIDTFFSAMYKRSASLISAFGLSQNGAKPALVSQKDITEGTFNTSRNFGRDLRKNIIRYDTGQFSSFSGDVLENRPQKVNIIITLTGRHDAFKFFMFNLEKVCLSKGDPVSLLIILFTSDDPAKEEEHEMTKELLDSYAQKYPDYDLRLIPINGKFSRGLGLEIGASHFANNSLLFFCDIDVVFDSEFIRKCRANTVKGSRVYYPILFSEFHPDFENVLSSWRLSSNRSEYIPLLQDNAIVRKRQLNKDHFKIGTSLGYWRSYGYGLLCTYKGDFSATGGFDISIQGWGMEDVDLVDKYASGSRGSRRSKVEIIRSDQHGKKRVDVLRSVEPSLVHVYHPSHCDPNLSEDQLRMCRASRASGIASIHNLAFAWQKSSADEGRRVDIVKDPVSDLIPEALDADTQDRNVENDQSNKDNAEKLHLKQDLQFKHVGIR
ncbi:chondroitin sulfate synthase 1-like [Clavelina lepadiformis]|uniref:chondroitin sulfate synthase 1-like n=1 Tax=Clavelina lepadiformis TaxID=159417 RepID=UPI004041F16F